MSGCGYGGVMVERYANYCGHEVNHLGRNQNVRYDRPSSLPRTLQIPTYRDGVFQKHVMLHVTANHQLQTLQHDNARPHTARFTMAYLILQYINVLPRPSPSPDNATVVRAFAQVRWVVGSILHGVNPLSYFSFQPVLHDWCNKGRGMCYPVCGMVHIKEPLLLIGKSSLCGGRGFPFSLSE